MKPRFEPQKKYQTFVHVMRLGMKPEKAAAHHATGILMKGYPAKPGAKRFADEDAMNRFGHDLWQTLYNIYTEATLSGREPQLRIRWDDEGKPIVSVEERGAVIKKLVLGDSPAEG